MKDHKKYETFLNASKNLVGLTDFDLSLEEKLKNTEETFASIDVDVLEKKLVVTLSNAFQKLEDERKMNILLHELIHGRVAMMDKQLDSIRYQFEEDMVNDITRGFERQKKLRWIDEENYTD